MKQLLALTAMLLAACEAPSFVFPDHVALCNPTGIGVVCTSSTGGSSLWSCDANRFELCSEHVVDCQTGGGFVEIEQVCSDG